MKAMIKTLLREGLVNEGYAAANELGRLADDILQYFVMKNPDFISRIMTFKKGELYFKHSVDKARKMTDVKKYTTIKNFIQEYNPTIAFVRDISSYALFLDDKRLIELNITTKSFTTVLSHQINLCDTDPYDDSISQEEGQMALANTLKLYMRTYLVHELRHAYDAFVSKGNYANDKKSVNYYGSLQYDAKNKESQLSDEEEKVYLTLPHEYWARFTETVNSIQVTSDFKAYWGEFLQHFKGWDLLEEDDRKRLQKAVYRYWDLHK